MKQLKEILSEWAFCIMSIYVLSVLIFFVLTIAVVMVTHNPCTKQTLLNLFWISVPFAVFIAIISKKSPLHIFLTRKVFRLI